MPTKATERQARYDKEHTTPVYMKLNNATDADILAKLASVESKQGYIKALIRADLRQKRSTGKIPKLLIDWLDSRDMNPANMNDDELYSAALELKYDIDYSECYEDVHPAKIAAVTRYIKRNEKTCKVIPLEKWY